jgi:hypothetical protein
MELEAFRAGLTPARGRRSRAACWHEDDRRLVGMSRRRFGHLSLEMLAFGLQGLNGRALHLVVPERAVAVLRARAAWLNAQVHVHRSHGEVVGAAQAAMSPPEASDFFRILGRPTPRLAFDVVAWPVWLVELAGLLENRDVERTQTTRAFVWRYRGRQVLSVRPARAGALELTAGADLPSFGSNRPNPIHRTVTAGTTLTSRELEEIRTAIETAIDRRRTGKDIGHRERLLQATIGSQPALIGMTRLEREVPAWRPRLRPRRGRAFIDLLGRDVDGTGHVIETKIRLDPQLGIQALDYWAWADAHRTRLAESTDADPSRRFELDLVLGCSTQSQLHHAAAATLQALSSEVSWRCHLVTEWDTTAEPERPRTPRAESLVPRQLPD